MAENEYKTYTGKNVQECLASALADLQASEDQIEYEVVDEGKSGFLGFKARPAEIRARLKKSETELALERGREFLENVFREMNLKVSIDMNYDEAEKTVSINLSGDNMGVLIGKRGQTLDSLQHLVSLVINRSTEDFLRVKMDTENYRERRKETLEMLAKNVAAKVLRTRKPVALEAMNPYERRIIHIALQDEKYVYTKSEGEEPYRHVVVCLSDDAPMPKYNKYDSRRGGGRRSYGNRGGYSRSGNRQHRDYSSYADTLEGTGDTDGQTYEEYLAAQRARKAKPESGSANDAVNSDSDDSGDAENS